METINIHNYENFAMDYLEGNLDNSTKSAFEKFLQLHPSIKIEIESLSGFQVSMIDDEFPEKESLKKEVRDLEMTGDEIEFDCIAYLEGDLNPEHAEEFTNMVESITEYKDKLQMFRSVYFEADQNITFNRKSKLKKHPRLYFLFPVSTAIAASVALLIFFNMPKYQNVEGQIAIRSTHPEIKIQNPNKEKIVYSEKTVFNTQTLEKKTISNIEEVRKQTDLLSENLHLKTLAKLEIAPRILNKNVRFSEYQINQIEKDNLVDLAKKIYNNLRYPDRKKSKIDIWEFAYASIESYNQLSESQIKLKRIKDKQNKTKAFSIQAESFSFYKNLNSSTQ